MSNAVIISNRFFLALALISMSLCSSSLVAFNPKLQDASMKINGQITNRLGPAACKNKQAPVEIILDQSLWQLKEFRAFAIRVTDKDKRECPKSPQDNTAGLAQFYDNKRTIDQDILLINSDACTGSDGAEGMRILCIYPYASGEEKAIAKIPFSYDTRTAKLDKFDNVFAANGVISFTPRVSGGAVPNIAICYGPAQGDVDPDKCPQVADWKRDKKPVGEIKLKDLDPRTAYRVKVKLLDTGVDEKWVYVEVEGEKDLTPMLIAGPLDSYNGQGGLAMFSCQSSPRAADSLLLCALAMLFLLLRKRLQVLDSKKNLLILPLLFLIPAQESRAEFGDVSVGILGSMYRPNLDAEAGANNFYRCHFRGAPQKSGDFAKEGPLNPLMGLDVNWHLWDGLRLGLGVNYTYVSGVGLETNKKNQPICDKPRPNFPVSLHMYQIRPQLSYELDHFADYFPLFPYVRGALIVQGYHFFNGEGAPKETTNSSGKVIKNNGFNFGWQAALGLKLRLDFLEPSAVRAAQSGGFFKHVYLLSELSYEKIDNFGKSGFDFSPKDIMGTKLPLMWTFGLVFDLL
jgi:hypothetical protein